jgi:hypothetical protein
LSEATDDKEIEAAGTDLLLLLVDTPGDGPNKSSSRSRSGPHQHDTQADRRGFVEGYTER